MLLQFLIELMQIGLDMLQCYGCETLVHHYCYGVKTPVNQVKGNGRYQLKMFVCDKCQDQGPDNVAVFSFCACY